MIPHDNILLKDPSYDPADTEDLVHLLEIRDNTDATKKFSRITSDSVAQKLIVLDTDEAEATLKVSQISKESPSYSEVAGARRLVGYITRSHEHRRL